MDYSLIVSIVFVFSMANTLADDSITHPSTCDIKGTFHQNMADIVTNEVGIQALNELRQNFENICLDPAAHNSIISLLDGLMNLLTDPNASAFIEDSLYWSRQLIKNPNFHDIWHETMEGYNMWFDNVDIVSDLTDTFFDNMSDLLNSPYFDSTIEDVISYVARMIKLSNNVFVKAGTNMMARGKRLSSFRK